MPFSRSGGRLSKTTGCWIILSVFILLLAACGTPSTDSQNLTPLHVVEVTHSLFYAPQYVAIQQGFFEEEGIDLTLSDGAGGDKTMAMLLSDNADIALVGAETGIYVNARGAQDPVVAFAQLTQTDGTFLVSRQPIDSFEWDDLKGKTLLGQRKGGMPQMVSEYVQRKNGLDPRQDLTTIQNVDFNNLGSAFVSGTGDFAQLFEPVASKIEQEGKGYVVASFGKDSGRLPYTVYLTKEGTIHRDPELMERFVRALYKGQRWVDTHTPEEIADEVESFFPDTDRTIVVQVLERYQEQGSWATDPVIDLEEYDRLLEVMDQAGELPSRLPFADVIRTDIAEKVTKEIR
ncbi:ABC transporter substrate-binding protein [Desmospora profundinema]|uniref:NitT/TauT family transport system substrate-binding protein n=1 Tax=Desmospora profundinema TaxID=1571184 RepID=A0ABU1INY0_9BACL|nr:ABC transporter substrate-binding protein [Desmospora profundinema]MDR6226448.1 NitT/TauT family transport system substrate-binding protein [Desmospora profundinema]